MLQLRHPLDVDEIGTVNENFRFPYLKLLQLRVLLKDVPHEPFNVLSQTLFGDAFHDFDDLVSDFSDMNVDNLLNDTIGNSFSHSRLDLLPCFTANLWNWYVNDFPHCAVLRRLL